MEVSVALPVLGSERVRENDDFSGEAGRARLLHKPETVEPRHTGVSDDQLKIMRIFLYAGNSSPTVSSEFDVVASGLEGLREHVEHENIVVRAKHAKRLLGLDHRKVFFFRTTEPTPRLGERVSRITLMRDASATRL